MSITCKPDVSGEEIAVVEVAINNALGNILHPQIARNVAYTALIALRRAAFDAEKTTKNNRAS